MKIHAYRTHTFVGITQRCLQMQGLCGGITQIHALPGENVERSIRTGFIRMFSFDPDSVTCGSCRRSKRFALLCLDKTQL
jgi:hypothetical protein